MYVHEIELEFEVLVFEEGGKPENPEKNPRSKDENQQQTQPTYERLVQKSNPGHIGWRQVLSPLFHPCPPPHWMIPLVPHWVMTTGMDDTAKHQLFRDKQQAEQQILITNLCVASSGMVFMHNDSVIKDTPTMFVPFNYIPPAALPVTSVADVIRNKKQGNTITVSGTVKWDGGGKNPKQLKAKCGMES